MRWIFSLSVLLGFACLPIQAQASEEPTLLGKKASEWAAFLQGEQDLQGQRLAMLVLGNGGMRPGLFKLQVNKRRAGLIALQRIGPEKYPSGVAVIVTALQNDPEPEIRANAAQVLGEMYEKIEKGKFAPAREALGLALRSDPSARVREAAATVFGIIDQDEARSAVSLLVKALADESPEVVQAAADTIRRLGKDASEAVPALIPLLRATTADPLARTHAALALGRIGAPDAVPGVVVLRDVILHPETTVDLRTACVTAVGFFGKDAVEAVPAIGSLLGQKSTPLELRRKAIDTLDLLGLEARPAVKDILKAVKDDDKHVRVRALHALAILGKDLGTELPLAVTAFSEALSDSAIDVRISAINACALLGPELLGDNLKPIQDKLEALSRETQKDVAEAAKTALPRLKPVSP